MIAEIGVFAGEFSREILEVCEPSTLHLVDLWCGETGSGDKDGRNFFRIDLTNFDKLLARSIKGPVEIHKGTSTSFLRSVPDHSLDAVYLDGSHRFDWVLSELNLARRKVRKGGWIMGHDLKCLDGTWDMREVQLAVDTFLAMDGAGLSIDYLADDNCQSFAIKNL